MNISNYCAPFCRCDAVYTYHSMLVKHLTNGLVLIVKKADSSLHFSFPGCKIVGMNGSYVDDLLRAAHRKFCAYYYHTHRPF